MKPTVSSKPNALPIPRPIREGFEFRNVSFTYAGHTRLVLSDVSFHLRRGERLALVGENGQGKTTIVKLLTRLYDPTGGTDSVGRRGPAGIRRGRFVEGNRVIFQDFMRYDMTAAGEHRYRKNRRAGKHFPSASGGAEEPGRGSNPETSQELRTDFGAQFEGGVDLSGGEWQEDGASPGVLARCATTDFGTSRQPRWTRSRNMKSFNGSPN